MVADKMHEHLVSTENIFTYLRSTMQKIKTAVLRFKDTNKKVNKHLTNIIVSLFITFNIIMELSF